MAISFVIFSLSQVELQQSIVVYWEGQMPVLIAYGINEEDQPSLAYAPLGAIRKPHPQAPELEWKSSVLSDFDDLTARKLLTINRVKEHDTLVLLAAGATSLFFIDIVEGSFFLSLRYFSFLI